MGRPTFSPEVRWFDPLGQCRCGKSATGILRGPRNESYGNACAPCAKRALADADKARGEWASAKKRLEADQ